MSSIKTGLFTFVTTQASIVSLIGTRFYPEQAEDDAQLPYATYVRTSEPSIIHLLGVSGISRVDFQIDVYARSSPELESVTEAFRNSLDGFIRGTMGAVFVQSCFIENQIDNSEESVIGIEDPVFRTTIDISITYDRAEPTG